MEVTDTSRNCPSCNAMVRPKALFCHRCGRTVAFAQTESSEQPEANNGFSEESESISKTQNLSPELIDSNHHDDANEPEITGIVSPQIEQSNGDKELESERIETVPAEDFRNSIDGERAVETPDSEITSAQKFQLAAEKASAQPKDKPVAAAPKPPRPKTRRAVKTEYVWEESNSDPTLRLLLFTVGAVVFVLIIFWLARFIR